jgi:hypothetical protein
VPALFDLARVSRSLDGASAIDRGGSDGSHGWIAPVRQAGFDSPGPRRHDVAVADFTVHIPRVSKSMTRKEAVRRARAVATRGKVTVVGEPQVWLDWEKPQSQYVVVFEITDL